MIAAAPIDYRELARRRLPPFLFEYLDGGSYVEVTLRRNIADLEAVALRQRVLCNVDLPVPGARYRDLRSGLAGGGEAGVSHMLGLIAAEIRVAMALTGATRIDQIDRNILVGMMERNNLYGR